MTLSGWQENFVGLGICGYKDRPVLYVCIGVSVQMTMGIVFSTINVLRSYHIMNALILNKERSKHPSTIIDVTLRNKGFNQCTLKGMVTIQLRSQRVYRERKG